MIRLYINDVPEKYVAFAIARSGIKREDLELQWKSGCVYEIMGRIRQMICELLFTTLLFTINYFTTLLF